MQENAYYVYILTTWNNKVLYTGVTNNLERRMYEHNQGKVYSTARMHEPSLIFFEAFKSERDAKRREGYFKTTKGKKALRLMLRESIKE